MKAYSVIILDKGLNLDLPELKSLSGYNLPIWADYTLFDLFSTQLNYKPDIHLLHGKPVKNLEIGAASVKLHPLPHRYEELADYIKEETKDIILLTGLNFAALFNPTDIDYIVENIKDNIVKITINNFPVDLYAVKKTRLLRELKSYHSTDPSLKGTAHSLFPEILVKKLDLLQDIPGLTLFARTLNELFDTNTRILSVFEGPALYLFNRLNRALYAQKSDYKNSTIARGAHVVRSIIGSNVQVHGYVENSVLFANVKIAKGASVSNSIIMNNNGIGAKSIIENTLILPYEGDPRLEILNIQNNVTIGSNKSQAKNSKFPSQITNGLTVLGPNIEIPRGLTIEPACYIAALSASHMLKGKKLFSKGTYISDPHKNP